MYSTIQICLFKKLSSYGGQVMEIGFRKLHDKLINTRWAVNAFSKHLYIFLQSPNARNIVQIKRSHFFIVNYLAYEFSVRFFGITRKGPFR